MTVTAVDPIAILNRVRTFLAGSDRVAGIDPVDLDSDVCRLIDHLSVSASIAPGDAIDTIGQFVVTLPDGTEVVVPNPRSR